MFTENPMEREDIEESVKVETVRGNMPILKNSYFHLVNIG